MRNPILFVALLAIGLSSCKSDVEIYADYQVIPVIYSLIDSKADTNYVKITRTFCGTNEEPINAFAAASVYDSSNYPGKLEAYIVELKSSQEQPYQPTGRVFVLDTVTIHDKEDGVFYAPHQKLYYTTEQFQTNNGSDRYHYKLYVITPDNDTVTGETTIVGGDIAIGQSQVYFQAGSTDAVSELIFSSTEEAVLYEIGMQFSYREGHPGQPLENKELYWSYGAKVLGAYEKVENTDNLYRLSYSVNTLFNLLEKAIGNDTVWNENHPNVIRYFDAMTVFIAAAGEDFNNFYQYLQASQNGVGLSSDYSNITGGVGLFSSRIFVRQKVNISPKTKYDLFNKPWGFVEY